MEDNRVYAVLAKSLNGICHMCRVEVPFNEDEIQVGNKGHELFMERLYSDLYSTAIEQKNYDKIPNGIESYTVYDITDIEKLEAGIDTFVQSLQIKARNEIMTHKVVYNDSYGGFNLSEKAKEMLSQLKGIEISYDTIILRHDKDLVAVVEQLGAEASGHYSNLKIAEISSDRYRIFDYDGLESVITPETIDYVIID